MLVRLALGLERLLALLGSDGLALVGMRNVVGKTLNTLNSLEERIGAGRKKVGRVKVGVGNHSSNVQRQGQGQG